MFMLSPIKIHSEQLKGLFVANIKHFTITTLDFICEMTTCQ